MEISLLKVIEIVLKENTYIKKYLSPAFSSFACFNIEIEPDSTILFIVQSNQTMVIFKEIVQYFTKEEGEYLIYLYDNSIRNTIRSEDFLLNKYGDYIKV